MKNDLQSSPSGINDKILICPLNWGLGHATRCVPLIRQLLTEGHEPVILADGYPLEFLKQEFPSLRFIELPSYNVYYAAGKSQVGAMIYNLPQIIRGIVQEHVWLHNFLKTERFDRIISDNRFGMWNKRIHSVYITHQVMVKMPNGLKFLEPLIYRMHKGFINRYHECWIPDNKENGWFSGDLSHKYPLPANARFIGILSRFKDLKNIVPNTNYDQVCVVSGVEPQRTIFENQLIEKYKYGASKTLILSGKPQKQNIKKESGIMDIVSHLPDSELAAVFLGAKKIIARSGYSTIMDLASLNCLHKAEFIPTPGQTEQEYLADLYK